MANEGGKSGLQLSWKTPSHAGRSAIVRYKARISCVWRVIGSKAERKPEPFTFPIDVREKSVFLDRDKLRGCIPTPLCRRVECVFISITAQLRAVSKHGPGNYSQSTTWTMGEGQLKRLLVPLNFNVSFKFQSNGNYRFL